MCRRVSSVERVRKARPLLKTRNCLRARGVEKKASLCVGAGDGVGAWGGGFVVDVDVGVTAEVRLELLVSVEEALVATEEEGGAGGSVDVVLEEEDRKRKDIVDGRGDEGGGGGGGGRREGGGRKEGDAFGCRRLTRNLLSVSIEFCACELCELFVWHGERQRRRSTEKKSKLLHTRNLHQNFPVSQRATIHNTLQLQSPGICDGVMFNSLHF